MASLFSRVITALKGGNDGRDAARIPQRFPADESKPAVPGIETVPTSGYEYDPNLVPRLKEDHAILVRQFTELGTYIRRGGNVLRFVRETVQPSFSSHLILEQYFYASLEAHADNLELGDDPEIWRQFRTSMKDIARAVNLFLSEILAGRLNDNTRMEYLRRYQEIMEVLGKRISDEENRLYLIYERQLGRRTAQHSKPMAKVVNGNFGGK